MYRFPGHLSVENTNCFTMPGAGPLVGHSVFLLYESETRRAMPETHRKQAYAARIIFAVAGELTIVSATCSNSAFPFTMPAQKDWNRLLGPFSRFQIVFWSVRFWFRSRAGQRKRKFWVIASLWRTLNVVCLLAGCIFLAVQ